MSQGYTASRRAPAWTCARYLSSAKARVHSSGLERAEELPAAGPSSFDDLSVEEAKRFQEERVRRLGEVLSTLKPAEAEAVRLRFGEGLTYPEISERTGLSISTLQSRAEAALRKIRKRIGKGPTWEK